MTLREFLDKLFTIYSTDSEKNAELKEQYVNAIIQMRQDFNYDKALNQIVTSNESRFIPNFPFIKSILQENINRRIEEKSIYVNFYVKYPNIDTEYQYCFITTPNNLQSNWEKQLKGVEAKGGTVTRIDGYKNLNGKLVELVNDIVQPPEFFKDKLQALFN